MKKSRFHINVMNKIINKDYENKEVIEKVVGDQMFQDEHHYALQYSGISRSRFYFKIYRGYAVAYWKLLMTLLFKRCYFGTFNGEFGNFLSYVLPFLSYLHSKKVKIYYCGLDLYAPFMVDEQGKSIIHEFVKLPDFFKEVTPNTNDSTDLPSLHKDIINKFDERARNSIYPFWNMNDNYFYWFIYRVWIVKGGPFMKTVQLNKLYKTKEENSVVVFPRAKKDKGGIAPNYGEPWDYLELIDSIKGYFDKVYVLGHPAMSLPIKSYENVEVLISDNNYNLLEKCSNSKLIITQHSGTKYLGEYLNTQVLVIHKGTLPITGMLFNMVYNYYIGTRFNLHFAFSIEEIKKYCQKFKNKI